MKGMSLNRFKYHIAKPDAPKAIMVGTGHPHYDKEEIRLWQPNCLPAKTKYAPPRYAQGYEPQVVRPRRRGK